MRTGVDTIAAISSPTGVAGRAIVRASGPAALRVASAVFTLADRSLAELGGFRSAPGWVRAGRLTAPARAYLFRAPKSYTREDLVELHLPGHPQLASAVLSSLVDAGARLAEPGEFTQRAFLTGRIDLTEARAVADVITAASDAQLRAATGNAAGALSSMCVRWRDELTDALAEVEASIDLADESLELVTPGELSARLTSLSETMDRSALDAVGVSALADIPRIALGGRANAGKSSLLNRLAGLDRSIVSAAAGTTRDVLSAPIDLGEAGEAMLLDLAGLTGSQDPLESAAERTARGALASADSVVAVVDASTMDTALLSELSAGRRGSDLTVVLNKCDLLPPGTVAQAVARLADTSGVRVLAVSAVTGEGIADLRARLAEVVGVSMRRDTSVVALHEDERRDIRQAAAMVAKAAETAGQFAHLADSAEFAAVELRNAIRRIGSVTGETLEEETLGRIFRRFCVGK